MTQLAKGGAKLVDHDKQQNVDDKVLAKAIELAGMVDYQDDSVVSRTIIDKKVGTVTIFAFDKGQGLSEHTAPFDALVYIIDGHAEVTIAGKALPVRNGEIIIMPANKPHALRAVERFKMMLIMIRS